MATRTACPITRKQFRELAKAIKIQIGNRDGLAVVKEFSTGSLGWYMTDKLPIQIGEEIVQVQVGLNLTIVGSKELPKDAESPTAH